MSASETCYQILLFQQTHIPLINLVDELFPRNYFSNSQALHLRVANSNFSFFFHFKFDFSVSKIISPVHFKIMGTGLEVVLSKLL